MTLIISSEPSGMRLWFEAPSLSDMDSLSFGSTYVEAHGGVVGSAGSRGGRHSAVDARNGRYEHGKLDWRTFARNGICWCVN